MVTNLFCFKPLVRSCRHFCHRATASRAATASGNHRDDLAARVEVQTWLEVTRKAVSMINAKNG
jgi:hypothetical protein